MKKYIVISIIAVVALLPFAAWADDGGVATSTLSFLSVINTLIVDGWGDLELTQDMIENIGSIAGAGGGAFPIAWDGTSPNIKVTVQALSSYEVYSSYVSSPDGDTSFTTKDSVLWLDEVTAGATWAGAYLKYSEVAGLSGLPGGTTGDHGLTYAQASALTSLGWSGSNNIASGGEEREYDVSWDPSQLKGDLSTTSTVDFRIYFVVTDPTT